LNPLISVVIPAYNREDTIGYCIQSILRQSYANFEIVVVDDGSTDRTVAVIRSFQDQRIRVIETIARRGAQAARNVGIRAAAAEWIAFLDSDDEWMPEKLEKQVEVLRSEEFDSRTFVNCGGIMIDGDSGKRTKVGTVPVKNDDAYRSLLSMSGIMFQGMLASKSALISIGLLDEAVSSFQEWDTAIRLAKHCNFFFLSEPLFIYHQHSGDTISKNSARAVEGYDYIVEKFKNEIVRECGAGALDVHAIDQIRRCIRKGLWIQSKRYVDKLSPKSFKRHVFKLFIAMKVSPEPLYKLLSIMKSVERSIDD